MGCVANNNEVLETAVLIVHFQTTHIEPDKEGSCTFQFKVMINH
jgi:hypothetical protein